MLFEPLAVRQAFFTSPVACTYDHPNLFILMSHLRNPAPFYRPLPHNLRNSNWPVSTILISNYRSLQAFPYYNFIQFEHRADGSGDFLSPGSEACDKAVSSPDLPVLHFSQLYLQARYSLPVPVYSTKLFKSQLPGTPKSVNTTMIDSLRLVITDHSNQHSFRFSKTISLYFCCFAMAIVGLHVSPKEVLSLAQIGVHYSNNYIAGSGGSSPSSHTCSRSLVSLHNRSCNVWLEP